MKYIILGGNGFIGSYIVDEILANGHEVTVFDIGPEKFRASLIGVEYFYGDVKDYDLLKTVFQNKDILIHSVSTTVPYTSNKDIEYDIESNLINSVNIFRIAVENNLKRIVYLSSGGAIYGNTTEDSIKESHPTNPISSYGITKLAIEKYLHYFSLNYNIEYNIVRPSNPYGPRQNPFGNQGVIAVFLGKVLKKEIIEVWGDGTMSKDFLFIDDLAKAIYSSSVCSVISEVFNIGSGELISVNEILEIIEEVLGVDIQVKYLAKHNFDVQQVCLDISKAKRILNFSPTFSLRDGIRKTWDFVRNFE